MIIIVPASLRVRTPSEIALADPYRVARPNDKVWRKLIGFLRRRSGTADIDELAAGPRREALRSGNRVQHREPAGIRILARRRHLTQNEERAICDDFDADLGIANIAIGKARLTSAAISAGDLPTA